MRYIPLKDHRPDQAWLDKADALLEEMKQASDTDTRKDIIEKNSKVWGELKDWLRALSGGKCWFTQAEDVSSYLEVEHFRPKKSAKDADGTAHEGYWWLAFDWENYRLCTNVPNRKKSTFFPLREGCKRAKFGDDLRYEDPMLLDPTNENDPSLLSFNLEGRAIPSPAADQDWEKERVLYSIERYNLDFPALMDRRKIVWGECVNRIRLYLKDLEIYKADRTNDIARTQYLSHLKAVRDFIKQDRELSAVARACVLSMGDPRLTGLLQSA
jgi:uncharacterized protein (TIGR02646 family)